MTKHTGIFIFIIILFVYLFFAGRFKFYFPKTNRDYFTRLSFSFLQGKLDIPDPGYIPNDLSLYNGHYYLYRGPLPSIILMPIVFIFDPQISDILYTAVLGALDVMFLYLLMKEFCRYQRLKIPEKNLIFLIILYALGGVHFYLSVLGTMWFTSQIVSVAAFNLSLLFLFRTLNKKNNYTSLYLSLIFLGLSILGRYTFIFSFPFFLYMIYRLKMDDRVIKWLSLIFIPLTIITLAYYNYLRFGSVFESGLRYMQLHSRYISDLLNYGYFNLHFVLYNLYFLIFNTKIPDSEGTSIFITSPLFILLIVSLFKKHFFTVKNKFISSSIIITVVLILFPALVFNGTGWFQWGYRYALDIYPLLFLLLLIIINKYSNKVILTLVTLSILINLYGTLWMMEFAKHSYF